MTDVYDVFEKITKIKLEKDLHVVIDGTMLSGQIDIPRIYNIIQDNQKIKFLYYESCSKYLQLGLDIAMGGLVVVPVEKYNIFNNLRRNTGLIMYESSSNVFPNYSKWEHQYRMNRMARNSVLISKLINKQLKNKVVCVYPLNKEHLDHKIAKKFNSVGGIVTFKFSNEFLNQRESLNSLIEMVIDVAKKYDISITKGVSFGFSLPRISAASAISETSAPFLRLSVGDRSFYETKVLIDVLAEAFNKYIDFFERHDSLRNMNNKKQDIKLRPSEIKDVEYVIYLESKEQNVNSWDEEKHRSIMQDKQYLHYIVQDAKNNQDIGYAILRQNHPNEGDIEFLRLVIDDKYKGSGYGGSTLRFIWGYIFDVLKFTRLWHDVFEENTKAIKLYDSLGYTRIKREKDPESGRYLIFYEKLNK